MQKELTSDYIISTSLPKNMEPLDKEFFFSSDTFLALRTQYPKETFYLVNEKEQKIHGKLCLFIDNERAFSPDKSPLGSIQLIKHVSPVVILEFIDEIITWCKIQGIKKVEIKSYPQCYDQRNNALIANCLFSKGFDISNTDINSHLKVNYRPFEYEVREKRKIQQLNQCTRENFQSKISGKDMLREAYDLLVDCNAHKGYPVTMTYKGLEEMYEKFPDKYLLFTAHDKDKMIAMSISILINRNIMYNAYHADLYDYRKYSPLFMLIKKNYEYCQANNIRILDLGISSVDSQINKGLYLFKSHLGGRSSLKLSFEKTF